MAVVGPTSLAVAVGSSVSTLLVYNGLSALKSVEPPAAEPPLTCWGLEAWQVVGAILLALFVGAAIGAAALVVAGVVSPLVVKEEGDDATSVSFRDDFYSYESAAAVEPWAASPEPRAGGLRLPGLQRTGRGTLA